MTTARDHIPVTLAKGRLRLPAPGSVRVSAVCHGGTALPLRMEAHQDGVTDAYWRHYRLGICSREERLVAEDFVWAR